MRAKNKNSDDKLDPLAEELNFDKLEVVAYGPGWKKVPARVRSPKHLREARAKLARNPPQRSQAVGVRLKLFNFPIADLLVSP